MPCLRPATRGFARAGETPLCAQPIAGQVFDNQELRRASAVTVFNVILRAFHTKFKIKDALTKATFIYSFRSEKDFYIDILSPSYHNYETFGNVSYEKENIFKVVDPGAHHPRPGFWMWWKREGCQNNSGRSRIPL